MKYRKVKKGEPSYERIKACKALGLPICDAWNHNETYGCSNPECFKYHGKNKSKR